MSFLTKIFGDPNKKEINRLKPIIEEINKLEPKFETFSDEQLKNITQEFKNRLSKGENLDNLLPEAFAAVREAAKRKLSQRHFDVQLIGGIVLHQGKIAEMKTGEGKTLAATLAVYLNALEGKGAHVVTVNDYLAKRDVNWMGPIYGVLGMSVACITHDKSYVYTPQVIDKDEVTVEMQNLQEVSRRQAYAADILYGTNNEFGFDYLRDNMVSGSPQMAQRGHHYAIVDEVDSILIDEARTPLIISAPDTDSTKLYETFSRIVPRLKENADYNIDEKMKAATLTEEGIEKVEKILGMDIYNEGGIKYVHHLEQALRAQVFFRKDKEYVIKDGEIIIVDDFTGRLMFGRRYSGGLHQAIEAKEGVKVQQESRTLATITFQNYFRMYKKLAGMTGTAYTSAEEFAKVYNLDVIQVPTNKPMIRKDLPDSVYQTEDGKFKAAVKEIKERYKKGQPVLVGTVSIERNEKLSAFLQKEGIPHELLNAKNHEREAQIIAKAGEKGAVTVATNMAGRGVDIKLEEGVKELGGLHIMGTERHEARRIDDQLRGRGGRQGDPGSSQFFVSFEDDLMRIFAPDKIKRMMEMMKVPEEMPIENKMVTRAIENAQAKIEGFNFDARKHVLEYDDVMNKHREKIYISRKKILEESNFKQQILDMVRKEIKKIVEFHTQGYQEQWNLEEIREVCNSIFPLPSDAHQKLIEISKKTPDASEIIDYLFKQAENAYEIKEKAHNPEQMRQIEKAVMLRTMDMLWMEHLDNMEHLRDSVRLRAYGQRDPLVEYKKEGHLIFQQLLQNIQANIVSTIYKVELAAQAPTMPRGIETRGREARSQGSNQPAPAVASRPAGSKKIGRNDPCPCGSGKKYKKCCGR